MDVPKPSQELMAAVRRDAAPVRPLRAPWLRTGPVLLWAVAALAVVLAVLGLRRDAATLGWALTWGACTLEGTFGLGLVVVALGKSVPGRAAASAPLAVGAALGVALLAAVAVLTSLAGAGVVVPDPLVAKGPACFAVHLVLGLSAFALVAVLVVRARPVLVTGSLLLAALGTAMLAEGVYRLHCGISDLRHVGLWHGGAVVAVVAAGLAVGRWHERRAEREMEERLTAAR